MHAMSKRKAPDSVEYVGRHRRFRIAIYDDGVARLCFRRIHWNSMRTVHHVNGWKWVGDFTPEIARHIANTLVENIDKLADIRGVPGR
jgi:hypothetical protein